jgi:selenide,water dikinase
VPVLSPEVLTLIGQKCVPGGTLTNLQAAEAIVDFGNVSDDRRVLLADAQTSGGLLLCVRPENLGAVTDVLAAHHSLAAAVIGVVTGRGTPRIRIR